MSIQLSMKTSDESVSIVAYTSRTGRRLLRAVHSTTNNREHNIDDHTVNNLNTCVYSLFNDVVELLLVEFIAL